MSILSEAIMLDVKKIHPSRGAKYSPNLYKWLTKRGKKYRRWTSGLYLDPKGSLWIGFMDEGLFLLGCRLIEVLCNGSKAQSMAYPLSQIGPLEELTDFWERHQADGRCAIDSQHTMTFRNDKMRWHMAGGERECLWCGKVV